MAKISKAFFTAIWFMLLVLPVMGIKLNLVENRVDWQFARVLYLGVAIFFLSILWNWMFARKARNLPIVQFPSFIKIDFYELAANQAVRRGFFGALLLGLIAVPLLASFYQTNIMISAMLYIILALGLNIVVGLAGQLVLGYVAFYAVGAYAYGLLHQYFGFGFWICLPLGGLLAALFGLGLGFPVLRLRGDYLAIVTLGFGEIVRLAMLNWTSLTGGPRGISDIPRPGFFGVALNI
ncbi:MAG: branched-chain amino acid ABC transporter permease, partial [Desulfovibrio sp.]|nr:branched-chain amino acid ABC transporter permease [Desulfovibrio sp.]